MCPEVSYIVFMSDYFIVFSRLNAVKELLTHQVGNTCLTFWLLLECDVTGLIVCIICFLGGGENDSGPANCLFQALIEYLLGMKLSPYHESEGRCVSALHQSTGIILHGIIFSSLQLHHFHFSLI